MSPTSPPPWLRRLFWVKTIVAAGLVAGFVLSPRLWLTGRMYPLAPISDLLPPVPAPFDFVWFGSLLVLLGLIAVRPRPGVLIWAFVALAGLLALWDQSRWQPGVYQYLFLLAACAARRQDSTSTDQEAALNVCRFILASTYVWSGIQKLNASFAGYVFPWLV